MAAFSLIAGAAPLFVSRNFINRSADEAGRVLASSGQVIVNRIFDMEPLSFWQSAGSDDVTAEILDGDFFEEGIKVPRSIDFMAVLNHNLKDITIELLKDSVVKDTQSLTNLTAADTIISLASPIADVNEWRLSATETQGLNNEEKKIGVIALGLGTGQLTFGFGPTGGLVPAPQQTTKSAVLANGSTRFAHIFRADAGFLYDRWNVNFPAAPQADLDLLKDDLLANFREFMWIPEPGDRPGALRLARIVPNTFSYPYQNNNRLGGFNITCEIEDIGGA